MSLSAQVILDLVASSALQDPFMLLVQGIEWVLQCTARNWVEEHLCRDRHQ